MTAEDPSQDSHDDQCLVCLSPFGEVDASIWSCSCCQQKTHMLCIFQWTLRLSINAGRHFSSFTCPGCRTRHNINQLPGFQQVSSASTSGTHTRIQTTSMTAAADLLQRTLGIPVAVNQGGVEAPALGNDDGDNEGDDDEESQDSDYEPSDVANNPWRFLVDTQRIYIDIDSLTVNVNTT